MAVHLLEDKMTVVARLASAVHSGWGGGVVGNDWQSIYAHRGIVFKSLLPNGNDLEGCTRID